MSGDRVVELQHGSSDAEVTASARRPTFRPDIEGLRAIAVLLVVLFHAHVPGITGGFVGVDVFFVISGFLITSLLLRERDRSGRNSLLHFYARRARRILPAVSLTIVLTVVATYHWLGALAGNRAADDGLWSSVFLANLHYAAVGTQYLGSQLPPSPLQQVWSLAVEEQFYVVWPALLILTAIVGKRWSLHHRLAGVLSLIIVTSFAWSVIETAQNGTWSYFSPLTRAWELAIGGLVAVASARLKNMDWRVASSLSWVGMAAVLLSAFLFTSSTEFPGYAVALPVLGTVAVIVAGMSTHRRGVDQVLKLPPFQIMGRLSYSLYLVHWPILIIAFEYAGHELTLAQNLGLVAISILVAAIMHFAIENPFRFGKFFAGHAVRSVVMGLLLILASFLFASWEIHSHTSSGPAFKPTAIVTSHLNGANV